ncbi:hypothetical protein GCM10009786_27530 [Leucobacter alluvii]|uniref:Bacterial EndoU nuclease domain-containing protein n=1 Tax=Leucobacter alluvii TaxID=340321 RepID=A0ABN3B8G4_9MICO
MRCGIADGAGYLHIEFRHGSQWVKKGQWHSPYPASEWDMFMMKASRQALAKPLSTVDQGSNKYCYQSTVTQTHYTAKGLQDQRTWPMSVVISANNKIVITSFPGASCKE